MNNKMESGGGSCMRRKRRAKATHENPTGMVFPFEPGCELRYSSSLLVRSATEFQANER